MISTAIGGGKMITTTEKGRPGRCANTIRTYTPSDCTGRSPGAMMPRVDLAMLRDLTKNVFRVTLGGGR